MVFVLLLALPMVHAATIKGYTYDIVLDELTDVKVTIDTEPSQVFIAKDGHYIFEVPKGRYEIHAELMRSGEVVAETNESITVSADGSYNIDLILVPTLESEEELIGEIELMLDEIPAEPEENTYIYVISAIAVLLIVLALVLRKKKKRRKVRVVRPKAVGYEEKLLDMVDAEGRITQKELRKALPLSEAKISLMISDLESRGEIRKIKKGRGNIIIRI
jgi:LPXTG-motif cell wall-anchored protein